MSPRVSRRKAGDGRRNRSATLTYIVRERSVGSAVYPAHKRGDRHMMKGGLLWLIGIPLPIILLLWIFGFLS
jgi:hypothetical protein